MTLKSLFLRRKLSCQHLPSSCKAQLSNTTAVQSPSLAMRSSSRQFGRGPRNVQMGMATCLALALSSPRLWVPIRWFQKLKEMPRVTGPSPAVDPGLLPARTRQSCPPVLLVPLSQC
eukprot:Rmarinus@m.2893